MRTRLPLLALGANMWLMAVGWPLLVGGGGGATLPWLCAALSLSALTAGGVLGMLPGKAAERARDGMLWLLFPVATSAATASAYDGAGQDAETPLPLLLAALSACAFGAALAAATAPAPHTMAAPMTPLRVSLTPRPPRRAAAVIAVVLLGGGAICLGVVLPSLGVPAALQMGWGDGAKQGAVLAAVVGAALGATLLSSFLPNALRPPEPDSAPRGDLVLRTTWFLFLALLGAVTYYVIQP